jgi:hypothetical protein
MGDVNGDPKSIFAMENALLFNFPVMESVQMIGSKSTVMENVNIYQKNIFAMGVA